MSSHLGAELAQLILLCQKCRAKDEPGKLTKELELIITTHASAMGRRLQEASGDTLLGAVCIACGLEDVELDAEKPAGWLAQRCARLKIPPPESAFKDKKD